MVHARCPDMVSKGNLYGQVTVRMHSKQVQYSMSICVCWCFHVCEIVQNSFEQINFLVFYYKFYSSLTERVPLSEGHESLLRCYSLV